MCRKPPCTYLGADPKNWPRHSPLASPEWICQSIFTFEAAVKALAKGDLKNAIKFLEAIPSAEISEYVRVHAYYAYVTRLGPQASSKSPKGSERMPGAKLKRAVLERDSYTCQYCANPVVRTELFRAFSKKVGGNYFPAGRSDSNRHGIYLAFAATWDHVEPFQNGGGNDLNNLVTSCWPCNFGKYNYTLDQLGLEDPRLKPKVVVRPLTGLTELINCELKNLPDPNTVQPPRFFIP